MAQPTKKKKKKRGQEWPIFKALCSDITSSVTRLGDLLDFGQLFEAFGNN